MKRIEGLEAWRDGVTFRVAQAFELEGSEKPDCAAASPWSGSAPIEQEQRWISS